MTGTVLLCPPTWFDVTYSINPWMQDEPVDKILATNQWLAMKNTLELLGVKIKLIGQHPKLPDMVFTANAGTVHENKVVLSNFRYLERKLERNQFEKWFDEMGYETYILPDNINFEGCGDTIVSGDRMIAGYGFRSDLKSIRRTAEILDLELLPLKLKSPNFYHLDTCFSLLREDFAIYHPAAFSQHTIKKIKDIELYAVTEEEANRFACNSIVYKNHVLMPSGNEGLKAILDKKGFDVHLLGASEFLKSGGALQCMALWI